MTRDQRWLLRMTQKPKHRWLKVLVQRARDITSVIKYHGCNVLYKLHLLKKFSYRSEGLETIRVTPLDTSGPHKFKTVQCSFAAHIYEMVFEDREYFYLNTKDNKIVYVVKDIHEVTNVLRLTLRDVALVLGGKVYSTKLPEVRATFNQMELSPRPTHCGISMVPQFRTVTYDISKLRHTIVEAVIDDPTDCEEVEYTLNDLKAKMSAALSELNLSDLEVHD